MLKDVKLVVSDLDGTLLDDKKHTPSELPDILEALGRMGIPFVVASGRQLYTLRKQFTELGFGDRILYIGENGGITGSGTEIFTCDGMDKELLARMIRKLRRVEGCWPILCGKNSAYFEDDNEAMRYNTSMYYARNRLVEDLLECLPEDEFCKVAVFAANDKAEEVAYPALMEFGDEAAVVVSGKRWVDVMNRGTNKATALQQLCAHMNIDLKNVMAFGDYLNDLEMLELCGHSYAMENSHPLLLQRIPGRSGHNNSGGVTETIKRDLLGISSEN
ncbi:MAG: HAD family hydrolase [Lachnospiraceae bacterium]|nr:HAD family hydrolase [Lachnospiraceae bacterium]